jgi:DmsE family decaheme c-type cytochrome
MKPRYSQTVPLLVVLLMLLVQSPGFAQNDFKLKDGAAGTICLNCHDGFQEKMNKPFVHSPLVDGDCIGCHNPHTSTFEMLMAESPDSICYTCHDSVVSEEAKSIHQVVAEGKCILCHDPHASDNESNLLKKGKDLCAECHGQLVDRINESKFEHPPVREDCLTCHNAHSSSQGANLLKDSPSVLCLGCHETDKPTFKKLHRDYPVERAECTSCHDPHGSNEAAMLYDNIHPPVAKRNCEQCHVDPTSTEPFALKAAGYETCMACHYEMITDVLNQSHIHWPVVDDKGCTNCHSPHASPEKKLMRQPMLDLCGRCHADTLARQERAATEHPPIAEGKCGECHLLHGSDNQFLLTEESVIPICADCHEWQTHSTHPIGEDFVDPRNKNVTLQCISCHRTHGTEYTHFLYFSTDNELCVQCHIHFKR